MDRMYGDANDVAAAPTPSGEALEFVRFCHRRKRVGWPELYDEMCAVAGRGLYLGYGPEELAAMGIGFGLFQMPALATLVSRVVMEDQERRRQTAEAVKTTVTATVKPEVVEAGDAPGPEAPRVEVASRTGARTAPGQAERPAPDHGSIRIALAAGA